MQPMNEQSSLQDDYSEAHPHLSTNEATPQRRTTSYAIEEINTWQGVVLPELDCLIRRDEVVTLFCTVFDITPAQFRSLHFPDLINRSYYHSMFAVRRYGGERANKRWLKSRIIGLIISIKRGGLPPDETLTSLEAEQEERRRRGEPLRTPAADRSFVQRQPAHA